MSAITTTREGGVMHAVMHVPPANALGDDLLDGLTEALDAFESCNAKVLVLSSALPRFFVAGAEIDLMARLDGEGMRRYIARTRTPLDRLASSGRVTIAAIDGLALGGGVELAIACTLRFATGSARLGLPEVKLGLIPGAGGTQRLPRLVGRGRALELMLSGRSVSGSEAGAMGLVDRVVDEDVVGFALGYAAELAAYPRTALEALLLCAEAADGEDAQRGFDVEEREIVRMIAAGEGREGLQAFLDKRPPSFA